MTPDRYHQVTQIYHQAVELEPGRRSEFLDRVCADDIELREEVELLVASDEQAGDFLDRPAMELAAELMAGDGGRSMVGRRIGKYQVLSLLGAGGMGEVWLARDAQLERNVALKLLPEQFTRSLTHVRRFAQEARAASALNHPNIITIHEIGEAEGTHYIITEFVEGQTLRQMLSAPMPLPTVLEIAIQIADALIAAHKAGIVHRDLKPENVMVRPDGLVKVLDFGLAKLADRSEVDPEAPAAIRVSTDPGTVMGTINYMSPEQALAQKIDQRTDIFSLGVMLYEMVAGQRPFQGASNAAIYDAILHHTPVPVTQSLPDLPNELQWTIDHALEKDRELRFQTASDLKAALKTLKRDSGSGAAAMATEKQPKAAKTAPAQFRLPLGFPLSWGLALRLAPVIAALAIIVASLFYFTRPKPVLTERDTILLADFANTTGDAAFDGALKQGLAVQLGQSPFLNLFPDVQVRETLKLMGRSPDERVTRETGREVCQRQGLKALITGSITLLGSQYVIALEAINARNGEVVARQLVEAERKELALRALGRAASRLREHLGESLGSIQKFDTPIEQATTSSLDALRAYSLGLEQTNQGAYLQAIPFYRRAIELDQNFALAWQNLAREQYNTGYSDQVVEAATRAFELRERTTENEKFRIASFYHLSVTYDLDKAIEAGELWKGAYPNYWRPYHALADLYHSTGQYEKSIAAAREAVRLNPDVAAAYSNLAGSLYALDRFEEAKEVYQRAMARGFDAPEYHAFLFRIAYIAGDTAAMQQHLDWSAKSQTWAFNMPSLAAALQGRWREAQAHSRRATEMFERREMKGLLVLSARYDAVTGALIGDCRSSKQRAAQAIALAPLPEELPRILVALALCGEADQALAEANRLRERHPKDTMLNALWLPLIRAAGELERGQPDRAIEALQATAPYEGAAESWPIYLRGLACLRKGAGAEAAAEFQKILDHRGRTFWAPIYHLAHLGLARAVRVSGDAAKARKAYQDFFALWKDADADLPVMIAAKREYEELR